MNRVFYLLLFIFSTLFSFGKSSTDSVLICLDKALGEQKYYLKIKESCIDSLKKLLAGSVGDEEIYLLNNKLAKEYELFVSDSALRYIDRNLLLATQSGAKKWMDETLIRQSAVFTVSGMYKEALESFVRIDRKNLSAALLLDYYACGRQLYSFLSIYSHSEKYTLEYLCKAEAYRDSLLMVLPSGSPAYRLNALERIIGKGETARAKYELYKLLAELPDNLHEYARTAFSLALIYKGEGQTDLYEYFLALSAISDIKSSVKENAALQNLAVSLYEAGDIERAYRYIKQSLEDAVFCNARLRTIEISGILPVIDAAYRFKGEEQKRQLVFFLILVSLLSASLIVAIVLIYEQMKKLSVIQKKLRQSNHIKEEYIGHFLSLCSVYIEKLENFRRMVNRKLVVGQAEEVLRITRSSQYADVEQKEFYANFDGAFLHLYPNFVEKFNQLLQPEERFVLKQGELLNTELRIYALIRLGIDDTPKIAGFLHYSVNTIYTYRNKVKNKAISRNDFEQCVMNISSL